MKQKSNKIKLIIPLRDIFVTQLFGVNWVKPGYYKKIGYPLDKHPGIDFRSKIGCKFNIAHDGIVTFAGHGQSGSLNLIITSTLKGKGFRTRYAHCSKLFVKVNDKVKAGQLGGFTGNTGKYTTAPHLHFDLAELKDNRIINYNNGYRGCINPALYLKKNWNKSNAYHRYGRERSWLAEYWLRFAPNKVNNQWANSGRWIHRQLSKMGIKPPLGGEQVNAIIYGGWDFGTVINPSMYVTHWGWLTKTEFKNGDKPFCR